MADDDIDDNDDGNEDLVPRAQIRALEQKAKQADELAARLSAMERTEAFRSAGLDPNDPKLKYFVKGYEGDLTADAITAAATEAGIGKPDAVPPPDASAYQRFADASAGAGAPGQVSPVDDINAVDWRDPDAAEKILGVVERAGGVTTRMLQ